MTKKFCDLCKKEFRDSSITTPIFEITLKWTPAWVTTGLKRFCFNEICEDCASEISKTITRLKFKADKEE